MQSFLSQEGESSDSSPTPGHRSLAGNVSSGQDVQSKAPVPEGAWPRQGRTAFGSYASSPRRVTLADRKVCRTKTTGFGQESSSSVCRGGSSTQPGGVTLSHGHPTARTGRGLPREQALGTWIQASSSPSTTLALADCRQAGSKSLETTVTQQVLSGSGTTKDAPLALTRALGRRGLFPGGFGSAELVKGAPPWRLSGSLARPACLSARAWEGGLNWGGEAFGLACFILGRFWVRPSWDLPVILGGPPQNSTREGGGGAGRDLGPPAAFPAFSRTATIPP